MLSIKSRLIIAVLGLLVLSACGGNSTTTTSANSISPEPAATSEAKTEAKTPETPSTAKADSKTSDPHGRGGQIVETGSYHIEFLTAQEANGVHLDLFLEKGTAHTTVENAKITAQLQLPDGTETSMEMLYKSDGKHYGALLTNPKPGDYQVAIQSTVDGEPIKGRFSFTVK